MSLYLSKYSKRTLSTGLFGVLYTRISIDVFGQSSHHKGSTRRKFFTKDSIVVDTDRQIILSNYSRIAPRHDNKDFKSPIKKTGKRIEILLVTTDKGYDNESNHMLVREMNATSIIPVRKWSCSRPRSWRYRKKMFCDFDKK